MHLFGGLYYLSASSCGQGFRDPHEQRLQPHCRRSTVVTIREIPPPPEKRLRSEDARISGRRPRRRGSRLAGNVQECAVFCPRPESFGLTRSQAAKVRPCKINDLSCPNRGRRPPVSLAGQVLYHPVMKEAATFVTLRSRHLSRSWSSWTGASHRLP